MSSKYNLTLAAVKGSIIGALMIPFGPEAFTVDWWIAVVGMNILVNIYPIEAYKNE